MADERATLSGEGRQLLHRRSETVPSFRARPVRKFAHSSTTAKINLDPGLTPGKVKCVCTEGRQLLHRRSETVSSFRARPVPKFAHPSTTAKINLGPGLNPGKVKCVCAERETYIRGRSTATAEGQRRPRRVNSRHPSQKTPPPRRHRGCVSLAAGFAKCVCRTACRPGDCRQSSTHRDRFHLESIAPHPA